MDFSVEVVDNPHSWRCIRPQVLGAENLLFATLVVVCLAFRIDHAIWPTDLIRVPFWLTGCSTLVLLSSAFTMGQALRALRRWQQPSVEPPG